MELRTAGRLADAIAELRRPFAPEAMRFKLQTSPKSDSGSGMVVCYHDARLVTERLNAVCPADWRDGYSEVPGGLMCHLTVHDVTRCDVGWSSGTGTDIQLKTLYSDAFKRAGIKFGVGLFIYALPKVWVKASRLEKRQAGQKTTWTIPDATLTSLRNGYSKWLEREGIAAFGEPLGHGDHKHAQGDETEQAPDEPVVESDEPVALDDEQARAVHARITAAYAAVANHRLLPGQYAQEVKEREHSLSLLTEYAEKLEAMAG